MATRSPPRKRSRTVNTSHVPLPGSEKQPLPGAERFGEVGPDERFEVTVQLRSRADDIYAQVAELTETPRRAREHPAREAFAEQFGASEADVGKIEAFA